jgi:hypothetical protein
MQPPQLPPGYALIWVPGHGWAGVPISGGGGNRPDQGLPGQGQHPDNTLPGGQPPPEGGQPPQPGQLPTQPPQAGQQPGQPPQPQPKR